jgi:hypothetical protein
MKKVDHAGGLTATLASRAEIECVHGNLDNSIADEAGNSH